MKVLSLLILIFFSKTVFSQSFEFFGGISKNKFYDIQDNRPFDTGKYNSGINSYFGIGLHQIEIEDIEFGITISYEKFGGDLWATSGGRGGGRTVTAKVDKSIVSIGIFPFSKKIYNQLQISIGLIYSALLRESFSGTDNSTVLLAPSLNTFEKLEVKYKNYGTNSVVGFKSTLSYDFKIFENVSLSPHYSFYIGLFEEFKDFPRATKSMRHFFGIGLKSAL